MFRPESQGELLDTTVGMMLDNDLPMELDVAFSNTVTIDTKCNCKSAFLTKKCVSKEKNIKCKDRCTSDTRKCKNQMVLISSFISYFMIPDLDNTCLHKG